MAYYTTAHLLQALYDGHQIGLAYSFFYCICYISEHVNILGSAKIHPSEMTIDIWDYIFFINKIL
jgi:hypothetical protein